MNEEKEDKEEKRVVNVEVVLLDTCAHPLTYIKTCVLVFLESRACDYRNGFIDFSNNLILSQNVRSIKICDIPDEVNVVAYWMADLHIFVYTLNIEGSITETIDGASDVSAYNEWMLPCIEFDNLWDHLVYNDSIKNDLLQYASSAFLFSQHKVNTSIISLNRVLLLHGPPGTGKTSLCKALAQKLAIHYYSDFTHVALIEINSHSLFSKWFSESGKLVMKLFDYINELLLDNSTMLFILIDEVESLSASRKASLSGSEPSDGMRVVNALLTQIDKLRNNPNVMILTTSNLSHCIDEAFVDRADIKRFIGPPNEKGRYMIIGECVEELARVGIIHDRMEWREYDRLCDGTNDVDKLIMDIVKESDGLSGRSLRKLPFTAYSQWCCGRQVATVEYLRALLKVIIKEKEDRSSMQDSY